MSEIGKEDGRAKGTEEQGYSLVKRLFLVVFSTGWLLPMWFSVNCLFSELDAEIWPRLLGRDPMNSFPFRQCREDAFTFGLAWLALTVIFWVWKMTGLVRRGPSPISNLDNR